MRRTLSIGCVLGTLAGAGAVPEAFAESRAPGEAPPSKIVRTGEAAGEAQRRTLTGAAGPAVPSRAIAFQPKIRSSVLPPERPAGEMATLDSGAPLDAPAALGNRFDDAFGLFGSAPVQQPEPQFQLASYAPDDTGGRALPFSSVDNGKVEPVPAARTPAQAAPIASAERILIVPRAKPRVPKVEVASLAPVGVPESEVQPPAKTAPALAVAPMLGDEPRKMPRGAVPYLDIFRREAKNNSIPLWLAVGVAWVESKFDPHLRGSHGVVGMMQVMPSTARFQGYRGETSKLFEPETNIVWGTRELGWDYAKAKGDICLTIAKYKGGISVNHVNSSAQRYCDLVYMITGMGDRPDVNRRVASAERPKGPVKPISLVKVSKRTPAQAGTIDPPGVKVQ